MEPYISTTPFGRRSMTLGVIASQARVRAMPQDAIVHKWQVFQHIREARDAVGATDRALSILNALLTFHPETALTGDGELVVWPSNEVLMARANGMSATTLRRHLAVLVECGLIIRRDSPNGKRYVRKGRGGEIEQAFGFDLSPIVARADEFKAMAEEVQARKRELRVARERLTLLRRDIAKLVEAAIAENIPGQWGQVQQQYRAILDQLPRGACLETITQICDALHTMWTDVRETLETFAKKQNMNANESHFDEHIQNSKPYDHSESENSIPENEERGQIGAEPDNIRALPKKELPLAMVLDACPSFTDLAQGSAIRHWREFLATAELARTMLGISPSAWKEAGAVLGEREAAITLAGIYERSDQIKSAGAYLRSLTERGKEAQFSSWPMIMALLRARLDEQKTKRPSSSVWGVTSGPVLRE